MINFDRLDVVHADIPHQGEDGTYYHRRWYLACDTEVDGIPHSAVLKHEFKTEEEAHTLAAKIWQRGKINHEHWTLRIANPVDIPYWATPEFAYRERHGLL